MKRLIRSAVSPWKTKYRIYWMSPEGKNCLLGSSNSIKEAENIAREQAQGIFESPFETDERKFLFLQNLEIIDEENERLVETEAEDYIDMLMSELDSRIKAKKRKKVNSAWNVGEPSDYSKKGRSYYSDPKDWQENSMRIRNYIRNKGFDAKEGVNTHWKYIWYDPEGSSFTFDLWEDDMSIDAQLELFDYWIRGEEI